MRTVSASIEEAERPLHNASQLRPTVDDLPKLFAVVTKNRTAGLFLYTSGHTFI